jgi:hypothetical protein
MKLFSLYILLALHLSFSALAKKTISCAENLARQTKKAPGCPEGSLVPETYPAGAVIISDQGYTGYDSDFTEDVVKKVLLASGENLPVLILPVSKNTIERVNEGIDSLPIKDSLKLKYKNSILHVPTKGYTWQQDYMQPFINPDDGSIELSQVDGYAPGVESFEKIIEATDECNIKRGSPLITKAAKLGEHLLSGQYGGNIETLPMGICLLGSDSFSKQQEWTSYADQFCKSGDENRIKVPTSWLSVGHTDEVMKVIRNNKAKEPCNFSVSIASPKKALELLEKNPNQNFLNFSKTNYNSASDTTVRRISEYHGLRKLCNQVVDDSNITTPPKTKAKPTREISNLFKLQFSFNNKAQAGLQLGNEQDRQELYERCAGMTNAEVLKAISGEDNLRKYNELIQEQMDALKLEVQKKLNAKLPKCKVDIIDVPNLFYGGQAVEISPGKFELPNGMASSFLPNPTNSISINDTIISPDPVSPVFRSYLEDVYKNNGLKSEFIDTFDYAHQGDGNLHCSTNTIHVCKPKARK